MLKKFLLALTASAALAGCEVPVMIAANQNQGAMTGMFEITFPAMMLVQLDDGREQILTGSLMGHASGNARYDLTGPVSGRCTGGYDKKSGINMLSCEDGFAYSEYVGPQRPKMSGVNVAEGTYEGAAFIGAFGWGNGANEASVRAALEEYKLNQG